MKRWHIFIGIAGMIFSLQTKAQTENIPNDSTFLQIRSHSTDKVTEDRMNKGLVTNPLNALSGQAAGVNVTPSGANRMAMLSSVRVRGTTSLTGKRPTGYHRRCFFGSCYLEYHLSCRHREFQHLEECC